jgi:imidazolonepropionase-like amidohydrolase
MTVTTIVNAQKMLMAGFTTVRDVASTGPAVFSVRDAIDQHRIVGPRMFVSGRAISTTAGHGDYLLDEKSPVLFCDGPYDCRKLVRQQIRVGADLIKISTSGGGSEDNGGPEDPAEMLDDEIMAVTDAAHTLLRLVTAHAHGSAGINAALRNGVDSIEHGTFPDQESIRLFKETGAILVPTLAYITGWDDEYLASLSPEQKIRKQQFIELQPKGVAMAYKAGVVIAAGTDFGNLIPHGENARELFAYVELAGMTTMDAITSATVNGAKLLRKEDVLGTLEVGKYADLIATTTSPLEDIRVLANIPFVMKDGIVYKNE